MVRKGNEALLQDSPAIDELIVWDKRRNKLKNLFKIIKAVRITKYDTVINVQRHFSTGLLSALSGAKNRIGFTTNPLSSFYTKQVPHDFPSKSGLHEIERNNLLIESMTDGTAEKPSLHFSKAVVDAVSVYLIGTYVTVAPASVWFTKQFPKEKWIELIDQLNPKAKVYLVGAPGDVEMCNDIASATSHQNVVVLAGVLSLEQTAAVVKSSKYSFVNDSAPLHMASAFNTPVCAIFCSTLPSFGFYPLSDISTVIETSRDLSCRPCGLHGKKECPETHFNCGKLIEIEDIRNKVEAVAPGIFG